MIPTRLRPLATRRPRPASPSRRGRRRPDLEALEGRCLLAQVLNTFVYNEITSFPTAIEALPKISADGKHAAFIRVVGGQAHVFEINTDGSNLTDVDPNAVTYTAKLGISTDGSEVLFSDARHASVNGVDVFHLDDPDLSTAALSSDGKHVFVVNYGKTRVSNTGTKVEPGLYVMDSDGSGLREVAGVSVGFPAIGRTFSDGVFPSVLSPLSVSDDGSRIVFGVSTREHGSELFAVNLDGSGLHALPLPAIDRLFNAAISGDGSTVAYLAQLDPTQVATPEMGLFNFDGSNRRILDPGALGGLGNGATLQLNPTGAKLLYENGSSGIAEVLDTDGANHAIALGLNAFNGVAGPLVGDGLYGASMDASARRFVFFSANADNVTQLATLDLNPASTGLAPVITNPTITPDFLVVKQGSFATVTARVTTPGALRGDPGETLELGARRDPGSVDRTLVDDGTHGDAAAGDKVFTDDAISTQSTTTGPRTVRVTAESSGPDGHRHAEAVEFGPITVVATAPTPTLQFAAASARVDEAAGLATITVTRAVNTAATSTVRYATGDGSAKSGVNYTATSGTLTFGPGDTSKTFTVPILDDGLATGDLTLTVALSAPSAGSVLGTPASETLTIADRATLHTFVYNQITSLAVGVNSNNGIYPVLSADGTRAAFSTTTPDGVTHVQVVNSDGTGLREVATVSGSNSNGPIDISADGSRVAYSNGNSEFETIHLVNADGTGRHDVVGISSGIIQWDLADDGKTVFFSDDRDFSVGASRLKAGLYAINADGMGLHAVATVTQIAALLGVSVADVPFVVATGQAVDASADGTRLIFGAMVNGRGTEVLGVNADGSGLHEVLVSPSIVDHAEISADGSTVAYLIHADVTGTREAGAIGFDGENRRVLARESDPRPPNVGLPGTDDRAVQLTADGSKMLFGSTGLLYDTATGAVTQLASQGAAYPNDVAPVLYNGLFRAEMDRDGARFLYIADNPQGTRQLATLDVDPASLGSAPSITNPTVGPSFVLVNQGSAVTVAAHVTAPDLLYGASTQFLRNGEDTGNDYGSNPDLYDDGTHGDSKAGDGTFANDDVSTQSQVVGPRTVRVMAESVTADGKHHATAVEIPGPTVVTQAPATVQFAASSYSVAETGGSIVATVTRSGDTSGTTTVHYATGGGTGTPGVNYTATSGTLTFAPGQTTRTFSVPVLDDHSVHGDTTVSLTLSAATGGSVGGVGTAVLTVTEADVVAPSTVDFDASSFQVDENAGTATVVVDRSGNTQTTATVVVATYGDPALAGVNYTPIHTAVTSQAPGQTSKTVTVPIRDDGVFGGDVIVGLALISPGDGTTLGDDRATLVIHNTDPAPQPPVVKFTAASFGVDENAGTASILVTRSGNVQGTSSVRVTTAGGGAVPGVNYSAVNTIIQFGPGETSKTVAVPVLDDHVVGADTTVGVVLSDASDGEVIAAPAAATLTIRNVDAPPPVVALSVRISTTKVKKKKVVTIVVQFSDALNALDAQQAGDYQLVNPGKDKKFGTKDDKISGFVSGVYDNVAHTVMLTPRGAFAPTQTVQLRISGLRDSSGRPLDGNHDGQPGGDVVATVTKQGIVIQSLSGTSHPKGPRSPHDATRVGLRTAKGRTSH